MKKILILLMMFITINSYSAGISDGTSAPCDNDTLSKYSGTVNAEINWEPNTIGLNWYDGDTKLTVANASQTCTYDGMITVPAQPTKPGYTFNGWKVIPVPGGCKKIEYLESNGTQYINTGYSAPNGFKAQIGFLSPALANGHIIGSHNEDRPYGRNYLYIYDSLFSIGAGDYWKSSYTIQANTRYDIEFSTVKNNVFLTGDNIILWGGEGDTTMIRSTYPLCLFGMNRIVCGGDFIGRIYYAKIYDENGTMVRDFIPILDKNNVPCMWDKITGQFFYNGGTGNFIAGPEVQ